MNVPNNHHKLPFCSAGVVNHCGRANSSLCCIKHMNCLAVAVTMVLSFLENISPPQILFGFFERYATQLPCLHEGLDAHNDE